MVSQKRKLRKRWKEGKIKMMYEETDLSDRSIHGDPQSSFLYVRQGDYIPRVAAIHDLCGYGKCSLGVAIPILSAAGCDVCPVPTGLFSSHTGYPNFYMHDTTSILKDYLTAWGGIDIDIDAVYSGFLGSSEQVDVIKSVYETYPKALKVVDPVMADNGKVYPTYTKELCDAMAELSSHADILTPNLTEACIILGMPIGDEWRGTDLTDAEAEEMLDGLLAIGAKNVILKGIKREGDDVVRNFVKGKDFNDTIEVVNEYVPYSLHGTGDVYASCVLGAIMAGRSLVEAVAFASEFVHEALLLSAKQPNFMERGVNFELLLDRVSALLKD